MLEYLIVAQQSCQTGNCSQVATAKPVKAEVFVVEPKQAQLIFVPVEQPRPRLQLPVLFPPRQAVPVVYICQGGKCK